MMFFRIIKQKHIKNAIGYYYKKHSFPEDTRRFPQNSSQQEIMDYLGGELEAQKVAGELPSQIAVVEAAKIDELRSRGLLSRANTRSPIYYAKGSIYRG